MRKDWLELPITKKAFNLLSNEDIIVSPIAKYYVRLLYYTGKGTNQDFKRLDCIFKRLPRPVVNQHKIF